MRGGGRTLLVLCLLGLATAPARAEERWVGTYVLRPSPGAGERPRRVLLQIEDDGQGGFHVWRQGTYADGAMTPVEEGVGRLDGNAVLGVSFRATEGLSGALIGSAPPASSAASFKLKGTALVGMYRGPDRAGERRTWLESGRRSSLEPAEEAGPETGTPEPGSSPSGGLGDGEGLHLPLSGSYLAGQRLAIRLPDGDTLRVQGPARRDGSSLQLEGPGKVVLEANHAGQALRRELEVVNAELVQLRVEVLTPLEGQQGDAHFRPGEPEVRAPAVIQHRTPLALRVRLRTPVPLSEPAEVELAAQDGAVRCVAQVRFEGGPEGQELRVSSVEPLSERIEVRQLNLAWSLAGRGLGKTPLRVYTSFGPPLKNVSIDRTSPATLRHFENAVRWANGARRNIGSGSDSIAYQVDNRMVHWAHWKDLPAGVVPAVPDYDPDVPAPLNYSRLRGFIDERGARSTSSLYYPPLDATEDWEQYGNYVNNYGWWLVENPTHVGGRCNQQASLIASALGTLGIKARVHLLQRTGQGKLTARPMRNYFYTPGGEKPWNFHGVALVDLEEQDPDGQVAQHVYDGSFSSPPGRKHGTRAWAESEGGPFIERWTDTQGREVWLYEDDKRRVPPEDVPDAVLGIQR